MCQIAYFEVAQDPATEALQKSTRSIQAVKTLEQALGRDNEYIGSLRLEADRVAVQDPII